ncbi:MAG: DUF2231 domain-containing protein [Sporocytophaga sp.]|jgi:uncharacterized membrane protein|nr:DUF2231 domain-containing protein [Sporocytophaga sp.]
MEHVHPFVVHFPLALLITASFMGLVGIFYRRGLFKEIVLWQCVVSIFFLFLAILSGYSEEERIISSLPVDELMAVHKKNSYIITVLFLLLTSWLVLRKRVMKTVEYASWVVFLTIGGVSVIYQAVLGSKLVYREGVGVKPMEMAKAKAAEKMKQEANINY